MSDSTTGTHTSPETEREIWRGSPSQFLNLPHFLGALLVLLAALILVVILALNSSIGGGWLAALLLLVLMICGAYCAFRFIIIQSHVYEVTTQRIRYSKGILNRVTTEFELYRVRDYTLVEPLHLRIVGAANLVLTTVDKSTPQMELRALHNAPFLREEIRSNVERLRQSRGIRELDLVS